jgi:hypothetical protein
MMMNGRWLRQGLNFFLTELLGEAVAKPFLEKPGLLWTFEFFRVFGRLEPNSVPHDSTRFDRMQAQGEVITIC